MNGRVLTNVERRQMKAEGAQVTQHGVQKEGREIFSAILFQTAIDKSEVGLKLAGGTVSILLAAPRLPQAHNHKTQEPPIQLGARNPRQACRLLAQAVRVLAQLRPEVFG